MHQETSADLRIDPPNPHKPPLLANVFHASRSGVSSQLPMFPYMDDGDKQQAILNCQRSLQLDPKNGHSVKMLKKLNAP